MTANGTQPKGFRVRKRTGELDLSNTDLEGATIEVKLDAPMEKFLEMSSIADIDNITPQDVVNLARKFGDELVISWDLVDDNEEETPISADGDGMVHLPPRLSAVIMNAWLAKMQAVPAPLVNGSQSGERLDPESIGLGELSRSLPPSENLDL